MERPPSSAVFFCAMEQAHNRPSDVDAEDGEVIVDGPAGTALSMTPEAAEETWSRLHANAQKAASQRRINQS